MLKDGTMYKDLGRNHFDRRSTDKQKQRLVKRLAELGYVVRADHGRPGPGPTRAEVNHAQQRMGRFDLCQWH
jgi:hypothetical protein